MPIDRTNKNTAHAQDCMAAGRTIDTGRSIRFPTASAVALQPRVAHKPAALAESRRQGTAGPALEPRPDGQRHVARRAAVAHARFDFVGQRAGDERTGRSAAFDDQPIALASHGRRGGQDDELIVVEQE